MEVRVLPKDQLLEILTALPDKVKTLVIVAAHDGKYLTMVRDSRLMIMDMELCLGNMKLHQTLCGN